MTLKLFSFIFLTIAIIIFESGATRKVKSKTNISKTLKDICDGGAQFLKVYNANCRATNSSGPPSDVVAYCRAIAKRFESADDIPESEQLESLRKMRSNPVAQGDICSSFVERIPSIITTLNKALNYFGTLKNLIYDDGLEGPRTIQAQVALALAKIIENNLSFRLPTNLLKQIKELEIHSKNIALLVEDENGKNWNTADHITSPSFYWKSPLTWKSWDILGGKNVQTAPQLKNLTNYYRDHQKLDECHMRMMRDCHLSEACAYLMMDKNAEITTLTHIVEFFRVAIKMECVEEVEFMDKFPESNWERIVEAHCSKMWNEVNAISNANFPSGYKAIFLVHGVECAMVGFPNFLRVDWIDDMMSWMNSTTNGCIPPDTKSGTGDIELGYDDFSANGEWCTIYETAKGMELLAMHMRYAIETCFTFEGEYQT